MSRAHLSNRLVTIRTVDCEKAHFGQKSAILLSNLGLSEVSFHIKIRRINYGMYPVNWSCITTNIHLVSLEL